MTRQSGTTAAEKWKHHEEGDCPMIGIGIGSSFSSKAGPHKVYWRPNKCIASFSLHEQLHKRLRTGSLERERH